MTDSPTDDGFLTSAEICYLPLHGTDLVTLSACETGLGDVTGGEGMVSIQRAFQVAGARSVISTLWKVDDQVTRTIMERFYRNYFEKEMSKLDSLREAQLWVLNHPETTRGFGRTTPAPEKDQSRGNKHRTHPKFWAPFVLSGDWKN